MTWIQTYTGGQFYPLEPSPADLNIVDIAHALSMLCRFNGHVKSFYSVAEHSVHVSRIVPPEQALAGLLHDATEAYLTDLPRPVKHSPHMAEYRRAEAELADVIEEWADLPRGAFSTSDLKDADNAMLGLEARELMPYHPWMEAYLPAERKLGLWSPYGAKRRFLERYKELTS